MLSLNILLMFAVEKGCRVLNFYGDSLNVINWINGFQQCRVHHLQNLLCSIKEILHSLDSFSCQHIYRENNEFVDRASKRGLLQDEGIWRIREHQDGGTTDFFHPSLFDWEANSLQSLAWTTNYKLFCMLMVCLNKKVYVKVNESYLLGTLVYMHNGRSAVGSKSLLLWNLPSYGLLTFGGAFNTIISCWWLQKHGLLFSIRLPEGPLHWAEQNRKWTYDDSVFIWVVLLHYTICCAITRACDKMGYDCNLRISGNLLIRGSAASGKKILFYLFLNELVQFS